MFLEPHFKGQRSGWIEVICGSMFSGKTEELIRRLKRSVFAGQKVMVFKPMVDTRYAKEQVVSHDANQLEALTVQNSSEILKLSQGIEVVGIDEAQFLDQNLTKIAQELALKGTRVILAGLDMDYKGIPFGPMPDLLAVAEYITKVHAICRHCGNLATHSYRLTEEESQVLLGEKESYEPRCRLCYNMGNIIDFTKK
jgi:thymidine kinase